MLGQSAGMGGRTGDADEKRSAARQAHKEGKSASEAGVTTGASKQIKTASGKDKRKANAELHAEKGKT